MFRSTAKRNNVISGYLATIKRLSWPDSFTRTLCRGGCGAKLDLTENLKPNQPTVCKPWSGRGLFCSPAPIRCSLLQVVAQSLDLVDQEVDVRARGGRVGDHHAEEVDLLPLWLVAHHGSSTLHHQRLDLRSHLRSRVTTYPH